MKNLSKWILCYFLVFLAMATYAAVTITTPPYILTHEDGTPVEGVTSSTTPEKGLEKASRLPNGNYKLIHEDIRITVTGNNTPEPEVCPENTTGTFPDCVPVVIEPETCPEGFEGTPPNCTAIVIPEPIPEPTPEPTLFINCANEWSTCAIPEGKVATVRFGATVFSYVENVTGLIQCNTSVFGDPENGVVKSCAYLITSDVAPVQPLVCEPPLILNGTLDACIAPPVEPEPEVSPPHQHGDIHDGHHGLPKINPNSYMQPVTGFSEMRIRPTTQTVRNNADDPAFRIVCDAGFMATIDPLVYFGQSNTPHNHTFFGNTNVTPTSTPASLATNGNSTCKGGIANRSAYWIPTLIDTSTNSAMKPKWAIFYYKHFSNRPPKGLAILAGDMRGSPSNQQATGWSPEVIRWTCNEVWAGRQNHIPACTGDLMLMLQFPTWWDGVNLDSPDHKSHMSYTQTPTHNVKIPSITFNVHWHVPNGTSNLRLSSDAYEGGAGGYSAHGDWMEGWDDSTMDKLVTNCLRAFRDCHANLLGNGEELY
jgi:hypothetical protein